MICTQKIARQNIYKRYFSEKDQSPTDTSYWPY